MSSITVRLRQRLAPYEVRIALLLLLMMAMFSIANWVTLPRYAGLDFCELWEIAKCQRASGFALGSPYVNPEAYQLEIKELERTAADRSFADANRLREGLDLPGTPLLFAAFDLLPAQYRSSLWTYRALQLSAFAVSLFLLRRLASDRLRPQGLAFAVLLILAYDPLAFDLEVGNVDCLQLLALIGCAQLATRLRKGAGGRERLLTVVVAVLATLLGMFKPNIGMALLMLALCVMMRTDTRGRLTAAIAALTSATGLAALSAYFFRTWMVWPDWWHATLGSVGRLSYPIQTTGNRSTSLYLSQLLGLPTAAVMLVTAALLPLSLAAATFPSSATAGSCLPRWMATWKGALRDPYFCIGAGLLLTFASSPLVWPHYFILGLIPAFWLFRNRRPPNLPAVMGFLAILLMGGLPQRIFVITGGGVSATVMTAARELAWTPLWIGLLSKLRQFDPIAGDAG